MKINVKQNHDGKWKKRKLKKRRHVKKERKEKLREQFKNKKK